MSEGSTVKPKLNWGLELVKFVYFFVVGAVLFLFFALMLDVVAFLVYGGWNPLLGKWPIFSGTVSAAVYGSKGAVVALLLGLGIMARVAAGPATPSLLRFLDPAAKNAQDTSPSE